MFVEENTVNTTNHQNYRTPVRKKEQENLVLKYALYYHKLGFSIIPARGKVPAFPWKKYQKEKASVEEIEKWFAKDGYNIALVTGKISGVVVIDVDDKSKIPEWLKPYAKKTWIAKTKRGYHFYFKIKEDQHVPSAKIADGVDLKGEGGIVILPPSSHPDGGKYVWVKFIKKVENPADFSEIEKFVVRRENTEERKIRDLYFGVSEGERNVSLTRIAGSLFSDGLNPEEVYEVLKVINQRNSPPLPEKEVRSIVKSINKRQRNAEKIVQIVLVHLKNVFQEILLNSHSQKEIILKLYEELKENLKSCDKEEMYLTLRSAGSRLLPSLYGLLVNLTNQYMSKKGEISHKKENDYDQDRERIQN